MDLITLQEFKDYNGIKKPDDDAKHSMLISSVSALIQAYLGLDFDGGRTVTETISLDYETNTIYLEHYPIAAISNLTETDRYTYDSSVHVPLVHASDYLLNAEEGILTRQYTVGGFASWPISPGITTVTYMTAPSWNGGDIPADLKLACIELVNYYKNEDYRPSKTVQGSSIVNIPAGKGTDFPPHIQVILDRYK